MTDDKLFEEMVIAVLGLQHRVSELTRLHLKLVRNQQRQTKLLKQLLNDDRDDWWKQGEQPPWT